MDWTLFLNFLVALLAITNPIGKVPIWIPASAGEDTGTQVRLALLATLTGGTILLLFLLFGRELLAFFGIDLASFRIAGGVVLLRIGLQMLDGKMHHIEPDHARDPHITSAFAAAKSRLRYVLVPLVFPFIAGPGTITTVVLFGARAGAQERIVMAFELLLVLGLVFGVLLLGHRLQRLLGDLALEIQTRLFGLVLAAIAVQLAATGIGELFPGIVASASPIADDVQPMVGRER